MRKPIIVIWILLGALLASNALWAYWAFDAGITAAYRDQSWQQHHEALAEALAIAPVAARADSTPRQVVETAERMARGTAPFEKDGYTWVGSLGLKFNDAGRLIEIVPSWSPY